jgi:hypothetical protein
MPTTSDISDILKAAGALLAVLGSVAVTVIGWAKIAAGFGERRAKLNAELDKKASRDELSAVKGGLQDEIRAARDESRSENMQQLERVFLLTSKVEALHKRVDANVAALVAQGQDLKENTAATLRTEAASEATREMLQMVLDRLPGQKDAQ